MTNAKMLTLTVPRETAAKLAKHGDELSLDGSKTPWQRVDVPGQRHPDKTTLSVYLPRTLMQRLRRLATEQGTSVTAVVENAVTNATRKVVLQPEDYEQIAAETRKAMEGRSTTKKKG